jgi:DNA (cytosine-5)-methyltransferase 1
MRLFPAPKPTLERAARAIHALGEGVTFLIVYYGSDAPEVGRPFNRPLRTPTTLDRFGLVTGHNDEPMLRMLQADEFKRAMGFPTAHGIRQRQQARPH